MKRESVIRAAKVFAKRYSTYELGDFNERFVVDDLIDGLSFIVKETYQGAANYEEPGEAWSILEVMDNSGNITFWKVPGWYSSHEGTQYEIDRITQVQPREKTIIVWE